MLKSSLFITYDGLLDPLGSSQILPYISSIASHPRRLHVVSFEKSERFAAGADQLLIQLSRAGIAWTPLSFTSNFGKLGKLWDLSRMYFVCLRLHVQLKFGVIHCRSYQAMQVGVLLSRLKGARTIFDMRGLWVNERVDGGLWPQNRWINRMLYIIYKRIERGLLSSASHVITLTDRVVPELKLLSPGMIAPITVIPCCADYEHFLPPTQSVRQKVRAALGIAPNSLVLSYLGSLGTWYMLEEMLYLFLAAARKRENVEMLFITKDWSSEQESLINTLGMQHLRHRIHIRSANRDQVPNLLGCSDIMLSFIKPTYSKIASSPTKLAEAFALGVPVISNAGVGDVDQITNDLDGGLVVDLYNEGAISNLVDNLDQVCLKGGLELRSRSRYRLGLEVAIHSYRKVYSSLDNQINK